MANLATIADFEPFWRTLTDNDERNRATTLLDLASSYLRQIAKNNDVDIDEKIADDETCTYKDSVKLVVMSAVKRAMLTPQDAPPADQWSQSASPYSETMTFTNPSSDIFFKTAELQLLGLGSVSGRGKIGILRGVR